MIVQPHPKQSLVKTMLVDLDGCLVRTNSTSAIPFRIAQFAVEKLGFPKKTAFRECKRLYREHGTNLEAFLANGYRVDPDEYHAYVHGTIPYAAIEELPETKAILDALPVPKFVYTNADRLHVENVMAATGLGDCFDDFICYEDLQKRYMGLYTACKPKAESMKIALDIAHAEPETTVFFDDAPRNVRMGADLGVRSVLVGRAKTDHEVYKRIETFHGVRDIFPLYFTEYR